MSAPADVQSFNKANSGTLSRERPTKNISTLIVAEIFFSEVVGCDWLVSLKQPVCIGLKQPICIGLIAENFKAWVILEDFFE